MVSHPPCRPEPVQRAWSMVDSGPAAGTERCAAGLLEGPRFSLWAWASLLPTVDVSSLRRGIDTRAVAYPKEARAFYPGQRGLPCACYTVTLRRVACTARVAGLPSRPALSSLARACLRLASRWPRLCCKAAGCRGCCACHGVLQMPALIAGVRASLCPLYSSCPSWHNDGAVACHRPCHGIFQRPMQSYCLAWAFPLPVTLSPLSCLETPCGACGRACSLI